MRADRARAAAAAQAPYAALVGLVSLLLTCLSAAFPAAAAAAGWLPLLVAAAALYPLMFLLGRRPDPAPPPPLPPPPPLLPTTAAAFVVPARLRRALDSGRRQWEECAPRRWRRGGGADAPCAASDASDVSGAGSVSGTGGGSDAELDGRSVELQELLAAEKRSRCAAEMAAGRSHWRCATAGDGGPACSEDPRSEALTAGTDAPAALSESQVEQDRQR
jgi:hypothetical protein